MSLHTAKCLILCFALSLLMLIAAAGRVDATTLTDYRERVANAATELERLKLSYTEQDLSSRQQSIAATVAQVRANLPAEETVVSNGERVEVDNDWLQDALRDYEKTDWADQRSATR